MTITLAAPSAGEGTCALADYVELRAVTAHDCNSSLQDLVQDLKRSGTAVAEEEDLDEDEVPESPDKIVEPFRAAAEEAFAELDERKKACGIDVSAYPFEVLDRAIQARKPLDDSIYLFLLLLSAYGKDAGPKRSFPERLFEEVCAVAASRYFGGDGLIGLAVRFGHPRSLLPKQFRTALDRVCEMIGEGASSDNAPRQGVHKDAGLDIVCWRPFPDKRHGTLMGFGQCATGKNGWRAKTHELQPQGFMDKFMRDRFSVPPTRLFFVPWRVEKDDWRSTCVDGGILFDRCRIALLTKDADKALSDQCRAWSRAVLKQELGA